MRPLKVCVVGSGWQFTSGISYYTCRLANAFAAEGHDTSAILMRRLIPRVLYPGRRRVGKAVNRIDYDSGVDVFDGVDWSSPRSLARAVAFLRRRQPDVVVLQWWTGAVLHSYVALARAAKAVGATVVVEFHETQDTGESRVPLAARYLRRVSGAVLSRCDAAVVHSEHDREEVRARFGLENDRIRVVPHGPFDHHLQSRVPSPRVADGVVDLLFFGTIRPYKGLEHLVAAFDSLTEPEATRFRLTIVGETWEGWTRPLQLVAGSRHRHRITVVNRYVHDEEVAAVFGAADAVVLPYLRSSASGPLHIATAAGLPVVVSDVGGLRDGAGDYAGAVWVPPGDVGALRRALLQLPAMTGRSFRDPRSWRDTVAAYEDLVATAVLQCA